MPWQQLIPTNTGGGRQSKTPSAKLSETGAFVLNLAAVKLLGEPAKVLVHLNAEERRIRLTPTTPENRGGFALSGGGNSSYRIGLKQVVAAHPEMVGSYRIVKIAGGIECRRVDE